MGELKTTIPGFCDNDKEQAWVICMTNDHP